MEILENFAVFEGLDGSGTTTQLNILNDIFHPEASVKENLYIAEPAVKYLSLPPLYITFEPTDGSIGKIIRSGLKKENVLNPQTIAMLFAADRYEHIFGTNGVAERCRRGELVVSDRYFPSSLVYQGITCGEELPAMLNRSFPGPETLIFFDINPAAAQERLSAREQKEIYEHLNFQIQVRERYLALLPKLREQGVRVEIIDASASLKEVAGEVWKAIEKMPIFKR